MKQLNFYANRGAERHPSIILATPTASATLVIKRRDFEPRCLQTAKCPNSGGI